MQSTTEKNARVVVTNYRRTVYSRRQGWHPQSTTTRRTVRNIRFEHDTFHPSSSCYVGEIIYNGKTLKAKQHYLSWHASL
jgi:hypothetical protein